MRIWAPIKITTTRLFRCCNGWAHGLKKDMTSGAKYFVGGMLMAGGETATDELANSNKGSDSGDNYELINFEDLGLSLLRLD